MDITTISPGDRLGSYEVIGPIARGGMATVFRVLDTRTSEHLALKILHPFDDEGKNSDRFRLEFRAMSRLNHPNVLDVREWGMHGERPWYTMRLLEGKDLKEHINEWQNLAPDTRFAHATTISVQIARALSYIHERGFIHRDITPGNVNIDSQGHVTLMDFGIVKQLGKTEHTHMGEIIGTFAYSSPEQISGASIDHRSDLYSLGVLIYQMFSGERPFTSRTLNGYLHHHLNTIPRPLHEVAPLVPLTISRVTARLLEKDPSDRFASATHLLHALNAPPAIDTRKEWPPTAIVGRATTRAHIQESLDDIGRGEVGKAFVMSAATGFGKRMMITAIMRQCRRQGLSVARGRPAQHDSPFAPLLAMYDHVKDVVGASQSVDAWVTDNAVTPQGHYRLHTAYRDWLLAIGPIVMLLDNISLADSATLDLTEYLIRNTHTINTAPVVFAFTEDSESSNRPSFRMDVNIQRHTLGPLEPSDVEELVFSFLGETQAGRVLAARLYDECNGAPAFINDMLHSLYDDNIIYHHSDGRLQLSLAAQDVDEFSLPIPKSVKSAIIERVAQLPPQARAVGALVALTPGGLDINSIISFVSFDDVAVMEALDVLEDAQVTIENISHSPPTIELTHERFRAVLSEHTEAGLVATHALLGERLESQQRHDIRSVAGTLAHHFSLAQIPTKAFVYQMMSGRRLVRQSLYKRGVTSLDRALVLEPAARPLMALDAVDRLGIKLHISRAEALQAIGDVDASAKASQKALALAEQLQDIPLLSECHALIGHHCQNRSQFDDAEHHLTCALDYANKIGHDKLRAMPTYRLGAIKWSQGEIEGPKVLWGKALSLAQKIGDERAIGYGINGLGLVALCEGRAIEARQYIEQSSQIFERLGMLGPLSTTRVNLVELNMSIGILKKALDIADLTIATAREVGHVSGAGIGLAYRSEVLIAIGRFTEARTNCREAIKIAQSVSNQEDFIKATIIMIHLFLVAGEPEKARDLYRDNESDISTYKGEGLDERALSYYAQSLALTGQTDAAKTLLDDTRTTAPAWPHVQIRNQIARGHARLALQQPKLAAANFRRALEEATTCQFRYWQLVAHHHLVGCVADEASKKHHIHVLNALTRSLAAGLNKNASELFLKRWDKLSNDRT